MLRWYRPTVHRALDGKAFTTISTIRLFSAGTICRTPSATTVAIPGSASPLRRRTLKLSTPRPTLLFSTNSTSDQRPTIALANKALATPENAPLRAEPVIPGVGDVKLPLGEALATFKSTLRGHSTTPDKPSIDTLIKCYDTIKSRHALKNLSPQELSDFMSLLGTLSVSLPGKRCIYFSRLASTVTTGRSGITYWGLVLDISRVKEKVLGAGLNGTDRFWIMRSLLAQVQVDDTDLNPEHARWILINQATNQYLQIWKHTPDPEVHVPYFNTLFATNSPKGLAVLVSRLCRVLELHKNPHTSIQDVLWRVVLERAHDLTSDQQRRILSLITTRLEATEAKPTTPIHVELSQSPSLNRRAINIRDLGSALGNALFPSFAPVTVPTDVLEWARRRANTTFHSSTPDSTRMAQLIPLVLCRLPRARFHSIGSARGIKLSNALEWRTVLLLSFLHNLMDSAPLFPQPPDDLRDIVNTLWLSWQGVDHTSGCRPVNVTRAILSAFFRAATQINDAVLVNECTRFCMEHDLFHTGDTEIAADRSQVLDLRVAYVVASATCQGKEVGDVLSCIDYSQPSTRIELIQAVFRHYAPLDADVAHSLYRLGLQQRLRFDAVDVLKMNVAFIKDRQLSQAIPFLRYPYFTHSQTEELVASFLDAFRLDRQQRLDPTLARMLGEIMLELYKAEPPSLQFKWPIRYFFQLVIFSNHPSLAMKLVETVHRSRPQFFTVRLFLRLARAFVRRRQMQLASRLARFVALDDTPASRDFHRKVLLLLTKAGAHRRARKLYQSGVSRVGSRTGRELIARAIRFKLKKAPFIHVLAVSSILKRHLQHPPSLKFAFEILVRSRRFEAARKVLDIVHPHLDLKLKTSLCNTFLHGYLRCRIFRNGRLVRQVIRTKAFLEREYHFHPDRITINIVMKAMLRWRQIITSHKMKQLFDHMVRFGYPASMHWKQINGAPFGTRPAGEIRHISDFDSPISFKRHVQPLYKMFVKAFFVRGDVSAARLVMKILREEGDRWILREQIVNQSRHSGVLYLKKNNKQDT